MPRGGLSNDPAKRRRQLEALARGSETRAATLRARLAELDEPEQPVSEAQSEATQSAAASAAPSAANGRVRDGRYSDTASAATSAAVVPDLPAPIDDELELEDEPEAPAEPGLGLSIAAGLFGVKRKT